MMTRLLGLVAVLSSGAVLASEAPTTPCIPACPAPLSCQLGNKCIDLAAEAESVKEWEAVRPPSADEARQKRDGLHFGVAADFGPAFAFGPEFGSMAYWNVSFLANYATGRLDLRIQLDLLWNIGSRNSGWGPQLRVGLGLQLADRYRMALSGLFGGYFSPLFTNPSPILGVDFQPVILALGGTRSVELGLFATLFGITSYRFSNASNAKSVDECKVIARSGAGTCEVVFPGAFLGFGARMSILFL